LLRPELALSGAALAIPLSDDIHRRGSQRYRPSAYGQHFLDLVGGVRGPSNAAGLLIKLGFISVVTKGHNVEQFGRRQPTTIRPTLKLFDHFPAPGAFSRNAFSFAAQPELIVLKNQKGKPIDYSNTPDAIRWRREMQTINAMLQTAAITMTAGANENENGFLVTADDRALQRVFNGDWQHGGRLAGGFWMNMERANRYSSIRINGESVANVDYSAFNLRACYALAGESWPFDDDAADPYIAGSGKREGWKRLTNALFNRGKPRDAWPVRTAEQRNEFASYFPAGTKPADAIQAIKEKHASIADWFERGNGLQLMRRESDLIVAVLLKLIERDIPSLPLHDSVIVAARDAATAKSIMEEEAKHHIGAAIPVKIETTGDAV
jgi:hypothetical protein